MKRISNQDDGLAIAQGAQPKRKPKQVTLRNSMHLSGILYSAEAAQVGLQRGQWPDELTTSLGNKQPLVRTQKPIRPRTWVVYEQAGGAVELQIFNE